MRKSWAAWSACMGQAVAEPQRLERVEDPVREQLALN
jgi:hypothetical protein